VLAFRDTLESTVELSCQRQSLFRRVLKSGWNLRLLSFGGEAGAEGLVFLGGLLEAGKITAGSMALTVPPRGLAAVFPQLSSRNTQVLRRESFAVRRTPLPQDDTVWELNRSAASLRYPPVHRGQPGATPNSATLQAFDYLFGLRFLFKCQDRAPG
jgi:hypothetical protein